MDTSPTFRQQPQKQPRLVGGAGIAGLYLWLIYVLLWLLYLLPVVFRDLHVLFLSLGEMLILQFVVLILGYMLMSIDARRRRRLRGSWIAILGIIVMALLAIMWLLMSMFEDEFTGDLLEFASIIIGIGSNLVHVLVFCVLANVLYEGRQAGASAVAWIGLGFYVLFVFISRTLISDDLGHDEIRRLMRLSNLCLTLSTIAFLASIFLCLFLRRGHEPTGSTAS